MLTALRAAGSSSSLGTIWRIVAPARVRRGTARSSNPSLTPTIHHSHGSRDRPGALTPSNSTLAFGGGLRRNTVYRKTRTQSVTKRGRMDDSCLKSLSVGTGPSGAADCRPRALRRLARPVLARRLQVRHAGHQGRGARRLGRPQRPRHGPLRLFRPWRIRRDLRRGHHRPLAGGKPSRCFAAAAPVRRSRSARPWAAGSPCCWRGSSRGRAAKAARRWRGPGPDRAGGRLHGRADVEAHAAGDPAADHRDRRLDAAVRLRSGAAIRSRAA